jgi:hypothetical protein
VKIPRELETEDAEDVDDAESDATICGGGYCGIGKASGLGGCEPGSDCGFCEWW